MLPAEGGRDFCERSCPDSSIFAPNCGHLVRKEQSSLVHDRIEMALAS